nr:MAG TPA: hypothetical protein [Caudoviricetes sp.]
MRWPSRPPAKPCSGQACLRPTSRTRTRLRRRPSSRM